MTKAEERAMHKAQIMKLIRDTSARYNCRQLGEKLGLSNKVSVGLVADLRKAGQLVTVRFGKCVCICEPANEAQLRATMDAEITERMAAWGHRHREKRKAKALAARAEHGKRPWGEDRPAPGWRPPKRWPSVWAYACGAAL
jgi:hypothetical protein